LAAGAYLPIYFDGVAADGCNYPIHRAQDSRKKLSLRATNTCREVNSELPDANLETLFKGWLVEHQGALLKVARAYTLTSEDCQDLAQEILLQVWRSLPQFQGRASATTWFYRVALNTALGWCRKENRRRSHQQPIVAIEEIPLPGPDGAQELVQREAIGRLYAAIRRLPKTDAALVLLYLDDLSYRQMAEVLGISESHVGVKLNRAKKALGEMMKEDSHGS
jgi:RNA polymerase sigma-70 factor, ECF subfamily